MRKFTLGAGRTGSVARVLAAASALTLTAVVGAGSAAYADPPPSGSMTGISCPQAHCVAVGYLTIGGGSEPEVWQLEGSVWVASTISTGDFEQFQGVSCPQVNWCMGVGSQGQGGSSTGYAEVLKAGKWIPVHLPAGTDALAAVSCLHPTWCMAIGNSQAEIWNGVRWRTSTLATVQGYFDAVSCTSSAFCTAVGEGTAQVVNPLPVAEKWDGSQWSVTMQSTSTQPGPPDVPDLSGISCRSADNCQAVGWDYGGTGSYRSLAFSWNGTGWTSLNGEGSQLVLTGDSCATATQCLAVGSWQPDDLQTLQPYAVVERWNGSRWIDLSGARAGETSALRAVACPRPSWCAAVGAVTTRQGSSPLVEVWDGRTLAKAVVRAI